MGTIIVFPRIAQALGKQKPKAFACRLLAMAIHLLWMLAAITWPVFRWIAAFDVTIQFFRMLMLFMDKGVYVDWTFITHFSCLVALTYFVTVYKPH